MKTTTSRFLCLTFVLIAALTVLNGAVGAGEFNRLNLDASYQDTIDDKILSYLETKQHDLCPSRSLYRLRNKCKEQTTVYFQKIIVQYELESISKESIDVWWIGYLDGRFNLSGSHGCLGLLSDKAYEQGAKIGRTVERRFEVRFGTQPTINLGIPYELFNDEKVTEYIKVLYNQSMGKIKGNESIKEDKKVDLYEESVKALLN